MKAAGVVNWPPLFAWFVDAPWQWAFGLCPTFWPAKLYWEVAAGAGGWTPGGWTTFVVGLAYLWALDVWLLRRFDRATRR